MSTYQEYAARLSRINGEDFQDVGTQAHLGAVGASLDDLASRVYAVMLARLARLAPDDALTLAGTERGFQRYPGEYPEAYRNRVVSAFRFWDQVGTVPGMLSALEQMGYGVLLGALDGNTASGIFNGPLTQASGNPPTDGTYSVVIDGQTFTFPTLLVGDDYRYYQFPPTKIREHFRDDITIWSEFSVYLTPTNSSYNADAWDDGSRWDDGTLWDLTLTQSEVNRVRAVIDEVKPAHARLRAIYLISQFKTDYWDDGTLWSDGSVWDADRPTTLYLRPGA